MWSFFWVGRFFYRLLIYVLSFGYLVIKRDGWDPINQFNPATFLCLSQARNWNPNVICCRPFFLCLVKMRGFCWYTVLLQDVEDYGGIYDNDCSNILFIIYWCRNPDLEYPDKTTILFLCKSLTLSFYWVHLVIGVNLSHKINSSYVN